MSRRESLRKKDPITYNEDPYKDLIEQISKQDRQGLRKDDEEDEFPQSKSKKVKDTTHEDLLRIFHETFDESARYAGNNLSDQSPDIH